MKKTKSLTALVSLVGLGTIVVPITTITSCGNDKPQGNETILQYDSNVRVFYTSGLKHQPNSQYYTIINYKANQFYNDWFWFAYFNQYDNSMPLEYYSTFQIEVDGKQQTVKTDSQYHYIDGFDQKSNHKIVISWSTSDSYKSNYDNIKVKDTTFPHQ